MKLFTILSLLLRGLAWESVLSVHTWEFVDSSCLLESAACLRVRTCLRVLSIWLLLEDVGVEGVPVLTNMNVVTMTYRCAIIAGARCECAVANCFAHCCCALCGVKSVCRIACPRSWQAKRCWTRHRDDGYSVCQWDGLESQTGMFSQPACLEGLLEHDADALCYCIASNCFGLTEQIHLGPKESTDCQIIDRHI